MTTKANWFGLATLLTCCTFHSVGAGASAPQQKSQSPGFYRVMLGEFEITALSDGTSPLPADQLLTNTTPAQIDVVALIAQMAVCMAAGAQSPRSDGHAMPPLMDREKEMNLALSACPPAVAKAAGVYLLTSSGYEKARDSQNGFTAIVQHSAPTATEPQCLDAEGSRTILQRYLKVAAWRAQGKTPIEIRQLTKEAFDKGELQAPSRPGIDYMLSNANTVPNEKGEHVPYVPHVMFFGTHLTNADLGVGKELGPDGQPIGPAYVAGEGSPYALIIVPVAAPGGHVHKDADAPN